MESTRRNRISELVVVSSLVFAILAVAYLVLSGGDRWRYTLRLQTASQLVPGNEVRIGGNPVGSVDDISLADDYVAEVEISLERQITEGTIAAVRTASQSGIANRYLSLTPAAGDGVPNLPSGSTIDQADTVSSVDFDQLLDAFGPQTRQGLRSFIRGSAEIFRGNSERAAATFHYLFPALDENRQLLEELASDRDALEGFLANGATTLAAIADRSEDLTSLVTSTDIALAAVAAENEALSASLARLPSTLSEGTATLAALRAARADLDPLVEASLAGSRGLTPFLRRSTPVLEAAVPVLGDLGSALLREGAGNDIADLLGSAPATAKAAAGAEQPVLDALGDSQHVVAFARPYAPDLIAWLAKFGASSAYYDANGHYVRVSPANANVFSVDEPAGTLAPIYSDPSLQYAGMQIGGGLPCPGAATQPATDGSSPFTDHGRLGPGKCDPAFVPPGP